MVFSRILDLKNTFWSCCKKQLMVNLLDKTFTVPTEFRAQVVKITPEYVARPDLLSYQMYGDEMYSDVLMKINGISNPYELNEGMYLVIPVASYITKFLHKPSNKWSEPLYDTTVESSPSTNGKTTTKKTDKHKPNEAVIGDTRYNIDKASKIVIY